MTSSPGHNGVLLVVGVLDAEGGLQRQVRLLASRLGTTRPVVILTWRPGRPRRWHAEPGVEVLSVPSLTSWGHDAGRALSLANTAVSIVTGLAGALWTRRRWASAHGAGLHPEATVAGLAATVLRRRFGAQTWLVGPLGNVERLRRSSLRPAVIRLLRRATWIAAETPEAVEELASLGIDADAIQMIVQGVDVARFAPPTAEERLAARRRLGCTADRVAVFVGRFDLRQKRLDLLLDGWRDAGLEGWELLLVGAGPDGAPVEQLATRTPGVRVLAWQDDVRPVLHAADLAVLPTEFETTALAVMEALASGLPVVASRIRRFAEVAPPGVELAKNDRSSWASALRAMDQRVRERQGASEGRRWVSENVELSSTVAAYARLFDGLPAGA